MLAETKNLLNANKVCDCVYVFSNAYVLDRQVEDMTKRLIGTHDRTGAIIS